MEILAVEPDLTRAGDAEKVLQATLDGFGQLDILVNNVGGARGDPAGPPAMSIGMRCCSSISCRPCA